MHSRNQRRRCSPPDSRAALVQTTSKMMLAQSAAASASPSKPLRAPRDNLFSKAPLAVYPPKVSRGKPCLSVPVVSLEKMPCFGRAEGPNVRVNSTSSSSPAPAKPSLAPPPSHKPQERLLNGKGPVAQSYAFDRRPAAPPSPADRRPAVSPSPLDRRPSPSSTMSRHQTPPPPLDKPLGVTPSLQDRKTPNGTKNNKPYKRQSGRVFDPNKHCGVVDPESGRPCTRSLTCKTHSLTHRRAVPGRKKPFDTLLAEHKGRAKEKEKEKEREKCVKAEQPTSRESSLIIQAYDPANGASANGHDGKTSSLKMRLAGVYVPRPLGGGAVSALAPCTGPVSNPAPLCVMEEGNSRLSSDEGECEVPEDCHYSPRHPHPTACCAFGSRLLGRGCYVFDRRWDQTRAAVHRMVERHVNSFMWKKIPLAAESPAPQPLSHPSSSTGSPCSVTPPLLSPPPLAHTSDGITAVSYLPAFPHGSGGVFNVVNTAPDPAHHDRQARTKPGRGLRVCEKPTGGTGGKKRKGLLSSVPLAPPIRGSTASNCIGSSSLPASGDSLTTLCAKHEPSVFSGLQHTDSFRHPGTTGDTSHTSHGLFSTHAEAKKRRSSSFHGKPGKVTKVSRLNSVYSQSSTGLLSAVSEPPMQPKVHH